MRIKITFKLPHHRQLLTLNYQYPLSSWIYRVLEKGDREFSKFLHEKGYQLENQKRFKLFTFSGLQFPAKTSQIIKGSDRMEIFSGTAQLILAFQVPAAVGTFITGLFKDQKAKIGDQISSMKMEVANVEMLPEPAIGSMMKIRALSPVVISKLGDGDRYEQYLKPGDKDYDTLFFKNLTDKFSIFALNNDGKKVLTGERLSFRCLTTAPKSRLQTIKAHTSEEVKVKGYLFDFEIEAPPELIKTGLDSGFGAMNALGFGCGEIINNNIKNEL